MLSVRDKVRIDPPDALFRVRRLLDGQHATRSIDKNWEGREGIVPWTFPVLTIKVPNSN